MILRLPPKRRGLARLKNRNIPWPKMNSTFGACLTDLIFSSGCEFYPASRGSLRRGEGSQKRSEFRSGAPFLKPCTELFGAHPECSLLRAYRRVRLKSRVNVILAFLLSWYFDWLNTSTKTPIYFFGCFEYLNTSKKVAKNLRDGFYTLRFTPKAWPFQWSSAPPRRRRKLLHGNLTLVVLGKVLPKP